MTASTLKPTLPDHTDFGIFYPVDYLVVAFPNSEQATQVRSNLLTGGYEPEDCVQYASAEVVSAAEQNLGEHTGFLARLGWSRDAVQIHLDAAREGAAFLLVFAPGDTDVTRAMTVIHRGPFIFAHRYHSLAIEVLT